MKNMLSSYIRAKQLPVHAVCRNCQTRLEGPFCHICGQNVFKGSKRSFRDLAFNTLENLFAIDYKLLITLKYLLFFPGRLTKEYINGRIVRYVHPSKLFWFISLLFFTLVTININRNKQEIALDESNISTIINSSQDSISKTIIPEQYNEYKAKTDKINSTIGNAVNAINSDDFKGYISTYSPYVAFILIPFFAFLLFLLYRDKKLFYADYLAFALHFHSFVFILLGAYLLLKMSFEKVEISSVVFFYAPMLYFIIASWYVFRPGIFSLIAKSILIVILFGITIIATLIFFFVTALNLSSSHPLI